jgi:hypothetical protein
VGYCVWEWAEYDDDGNRINERKVPAKLERIWDEHAQGTYLLTPETTRTWPWTN